MKPVFISTTAYMSYYFIVIPNIIYFVCLLRVIEDMIYVAYHDQDLLEELQMGTKVLVR